MCALACISSLKKEREGLGGKKFSLGCDEFQMGQPSRNMRQAVRNAELGVCEGNAVLER